MENLKPFQAASYNKEVRIPILSGRPDRDTIISIDDIMNLVILLNTTDSVSGFLEVI